MSGTDWREQRKAGIAAIGVSGLAGAALWFAVDRLLPPLAGMEDLSARMLVALKCCCIAALFCLFGGVEAVAHERLQSAAFDPLAGQETTRLRVNKQYLQNTLEQFVLFGGGLVRTGGVQRKRRRHARRDCHHGGVDRFPLRLLDRLSPQRRRARSRRARNGRGARGAALRLRQDRCGRRRDRWRRGCSRRFPHARGGAVPGYAR